MNDIYALERKRADNMGRIHANALHMALGTIKSNLSAGNVHLIHPMLVRMLTDDSVICAMNHEDLLDIWLKISDEIKFRQEEKRA